MSKRPRFDVDRSGLAALLESRGRGFAVAELIQNAWDSGAASVVVSLRVIPGHRDRYTLVVTDDCPNGFQDITHAYTLFARSTKLQDPTKRGRFNLGEKLVLSLCTDAIISTTTGTVRFDHEGRHTSKACRTIGSEFTATIRMTSQDADEVSSFIDRLIPPLGIKTTFNNRPVPVRIPLTSIKVELPTIVAGDDWVARSTRRTTTVEIHPVIGDEVATIYEMGLPVVETGDKWHVNVQQRVPLNMDRDNVTPGYLRALRVAVLNALHDRLDPQDANAPWARDAAENPLVDPTVTRRILDLRFGDKRVSFDPSDQEANLRAAAAGYTVVTGSMMRAAEWTRAREAGAIQPAGQVTPGWSTVKVLQAAGPKDSTILPDRQTPGMRKIARYAARVGEFLVRRSVDIQIISDPNVAVLACYGNHQLILNAARLGGKFFDTPDLQRLNSLLIHEFGHEGSANHLDDHYHQALCDHGARLLAHACLNPEWFELT